MQAWLLDAWLEFANDKKKEQRRVLETFVEEFIERKSEYEPDRHVVFYASSRNANGRSVQIDKALYERTEKFAKMHDTRVNRVLMTALVEGLRRRRRIKI